MEVFGFKIDFTSTEAILGYILSSIGIIFGARERYLRNKQTQYNIVDLFQEIYKDLIKDLKPHHNILREQIQELTEYNKKLKDEINKKF